MLPVLVGNVCASVLRVAGEGRGFPEAAYDECRRGAGSLPPEAKWRLSCAGAIALCLWMAMPYAVEITGGQNFGEGQLEDANVKAETGSAGARDPDPQVEGSHSSIYRWHPL